MPIKVILDVDTGSDDAVAIMAAAASPAIEVLALCTVWGNLEVEKTTFNTLAVAEAMKLDVPVYPGAATAMTKYLSPHRDPGPSHQPIIKDGKVLAIHHDKLDGIPDPKGSPQTQPAALFYVDYLNKATQPVTIVAVGPLTNLGLAFTIDPGIAKNIEQIVIMGGGEHVNNVTGASEANIWHDPEAAQIVVKSGVKQVWVPLDATHAAALTVADCQRLRALGTFAGDFAAHLTEQRIEFENAMYQKDYNHTAVHDALALCYLIDPEVLQDMRAVHCEIGMEGFAEGETIIDVRRRPGEANVHFAYSGNHDRFINLLCTLFEKEV